MRYKFYSDDKLENADDEEKNGEYLKNKYYSSNGLDKSARIKRLIELSRKCKRTLDNENKVISLSEMNQTIKELKKQIHDKNKKINLYKDQSSKIIENNKIILLNSKKDKIDLENHIKELKTKLDLKKEKYSEITKQEYQKEIIVLKEECDKLKKEEEFMRGNIQKIKKEYEISQNLDKHKENMNKKNYLLKKREEEIIEKENILMEKSNDVAGIEKGIRSSLNRILKEKQEIEVKENEIKESLKLMNTLELNLKEKEKMMKIRIAKQEEREKKFIEKNKEKRFLNLSREKDNFKRSKTMESPVKNLSAKNMEKMKIEIIKRKHSLDLKRIKREYEEKINLNKNKSFGYGENSGQLDKLTEFFSCCGNNEARLNRGNKISKDEVVKFASSLVDISKELIKRVKGNYMKDYWEVTKDLLKAVKDLALSIV